MKLILLLCLILSAPIEMNAQDFIWARQGQFSSQVKAVQDKYGNSYSLGNFGDSAVLDNGKLTGTGHVFGNDGNFYLAKYDPAGNMTAVLKNSNTGYTQAFDICINDQGQIYLLIQYEGDITIGGYTAHGDIGIFSYLLVKLDASYNVIWTKSFNNQFPAAAPAHYDIRVASISCDKNNAVYIYGYSDDTYNLDGIQLNFSTGKAYFAKLNGSNGNAIWAKQIQGDYTCVLLSLKIFNDRDNNVILLGTYGANFYNQFHVTFDGQGQISNGSGHVRNTYISKFDQGGNFIWSKQLENGPACEFTSACISDSGNIHIAGANFYTKLDKAGNTQWYYNLSYSPYVITAGGNGIYMESIFTDTFKYLGYVKYKAGDHNVVFKTDAVTGALTWSGEIFQSGRATSLFATRNGNLLYAGNGGKMLSVGETFFSHEGAFIAIINDTNSYSNPGNKIRGNVFRDVNANCVNDAEPGAGNASVIVEPGPYYAVCDPLGNYSLKVDTGSYTINKVNVISHRYTTPSVCPPIVNYASFTTTGNIDSNNDFSVVRDDCYLLHLTATDLANGMITCGTTRKTDLRLCNYGAKLSANTTIEIKYPAFALPVSSSIPWDSYDPITSLLTFKTGNLPADSCIEILITDSIVCGTSQFHKGDYALRALPLNSCYARDTVFNANGFEVSDIIVGINEPLEDELTIAVYPNPTNGAITVAGIKGNESIEIYDLYGRVVARGKGQGEHKVLFDLMALPPGSYLIKIKGENRITMRKLIKQ